MKFLSYGFGKNFFLTDRQFADAVPLWKKGTSALIGDDTLLPPPKQPSGTPEEHKGMEIAWTWGRNDGDHRFPSWVARQNQVVSEAERRITVWVREEVSPPDGGKTYYTWHEINVSDPTDRSAFVRNWDNERAAAYWGSLSPIPVDVALSDEATKFGLPFAMLAPRNSLT